MRLWMRGNRKQSKKLHLTFTTPYGTCSRHHPVQRSWKIYPAVIVLEQCVCDKKYPFLFLGIRWFLAGGRVPNLMEHQSHHVVPWGAQNDSHFSAMHIFTPLRRFCVHDVLISAARNVLQDHLELGRRIQLVFRATTAAQVEKTG